jgi:hypothetical protein
MSEQNFSHMVEVDESARLLKIYRIFPNGRRHLFTETMLPSSPFDTNSHQYLEFVRLLGENILLDSPVARRALGMEAEGDDF